jgi:hypothetical protein
VTARAPVRRHAERGYALLMVVFLAALMLIAASTATLSVYQQGIRDREEEMIWRGQQYARGVKLYFRKHGRFPADLEALTKVENGVRFMRQAYRDPMNREDGSWRLIQVGPAGQLIGSLTQTGGVQLPPPPPQPGQGEAPSRDAGPQPGKAPPPAVTPQEQAGPVIGAGVIGVASKVNRESIILYKGYGNYRQWEFIWNPAEDAAIVVPGQPPQQPQQPNGGQPPQP